MAALLCLETVRLARLYGLRRLEFNGTETQLEELRYLSVFKRNLILLVVLDKVGYGFTCEIEA